MHILLFEASSRFTWSTFRSASATIGSEGLSPYYYCRMVNNKFKILFFRNLDEILIFLTKSAKVARYYQVLIAHNDSFEYNYSGYPGKEAKRPDFCNFVVTFFELCVLKHLYMLSED